MYVSPFETFEFKVACTIGERYGLRVAAAVSTAAKLLGGYMAIRLADRCPVVVDEFGHTIWEGTR